MHLWVDEKASAFGQQEIFLFPKHLLIDNYFAALPLEL